MIFNNQDEVYFNEITSKVTKLKNIHFIEKVPFEKIQKYYDEAKIFISTSDFEGFANTFIQAGIGGTPVITLNSNPDDFINEYGCGYFANGSIMKLNKYVNELMVIPNCKKYDKFSKNIYKYVKDKYDIRKNIKVIEKLL